MGRYKPGMKLKSISVANEFSDDLELKNLQIKLVQDGENLELPPIGLIIPTEFEQVIELEGNQPDRISIITNGEFGICNVYLGWGQELESLGLDPADCDPEQPGIEETTLQLPKETPLVGFHGMVDSFGIVSLGLILLDTLDPVCQHPLDDDSYLPSYYYGNDEFAKSKAFEEAITEEEKVRA